MHGFYGIYVGKGSQGLTGSPARKKRALQNKDKSWNR